MKNKKVSIVLLNYNNFSYTIKCIESLLNLSYSSYQVVVCDNKSTDNSYDEIAAWLEYKASSEVVCGIPAAEERRSFLIPRPNDESKIECHKGEILVTIIQTGFNGGFSYGNNIGIKFSLNDPECKYFWLLNNDTVVDSYALCALVSRMEEDLGFGIVGSLLKNFDPPHSIQAYGGAVFNRFSGWAKPLKRTVAESGDITHKVESSISYVIGASMLVSREFLSDIGLMSEDYFLYFEELDWAWRAKGRYRLGFAINSVVMHRLGASTGEKKSSRFSTFHMFRSRTKFLLKHELMLAPIWIPSTFKHLIMTFKVKGFHNAWSGFLGAFGLPISEVISLVRNRN